MKLKAKSKQEQTARLGVCVKPPVPIWLFTLVESFLLTLITEMFARRSVGAAFVFMVKNPIAFFLGMCIIAATVSVAMLFHKKAFTVTIVSLFWLAAGFADWILLNRRTGSPLSAIDLQLNMEAVLMATIYYDWWQIILAGIAALALIVGLVILLIKSPRYRRDIKVGFIRLLVCLLAGTVLLLIGLETKHVARTLKPSMYHAYLDNGFAYTFGYSFFDTGIQKPENYSEQEVETVSGIEIEVEEENERYYEDFIEFVRSEIFKETPEGYTADAVDTIKELALGDDDIEDGDKPNIIMIQLESFCDPRVFSNYVIEGDPTPNFNKLRESYTTGKLGVPTVSGGTANTEFEVLTGCNLDFFGSGEFPFYTVLKDEVCESLALDLKTIGYSSSMLHSYTGSFYYRNTVYSNLCFDRFVSLEYMDGYTVTPKGWAKDKILEKYILQCMETTDEPDFLYTITVQTHGAYPALPEGVTCPINITSAEDNEKDLEAMQYYVTMLLEVDEFIKELTETLSSFPEKTIVVMYGDHLPGMSFSIEDLPDGNMYATDYLIWSNYDIEKQDMDLEAYQLGAYVLKLAGLNPGVMVRFHQSQMGTPDYLDNLAVLEYDLMYGEHYVYNGRQLSRKDEMSYGVEPVTLESAEVSGQGHLFVEGNNFTAASIVLIDGKEQDTVFVSPTLLIVTDVKPDAGAQIAVAQIAMDNVTLSTTETIIYD